MDLQIEDGATQVETMLFLPGHCGVRSSIGFMKLMKPDKFPGMNVTVMDPDGPLLKEYFQTRKPGVSSTDIEGWEKSGRLSVKKLAREGEMLWGAGGKPEVGRKIMEAYRDYIVSQLQGMHLAITWCGLGGGTGTAAAEMIDEVTAELGIPLISIITMPDEEYDPEKFAIAEATRKKLRKRKGMASVVVIKNSMVPDHIAELPMDEVYNYINVQSQDIFLAFLEVFHVRGTNSQSDFADMRRFQLCGTDINVGTSVVDIAGVDKGKAPKVDIDKMIHELTNHPLQPSGIHAGGIMPISRGPFSLTTMRPLIRNLRTATKLPENGPVKFQNFQTWDEMRMHVLIFGDYESPVSVSEQPIIQVEASKVSALPEAPKAAPISIEAPKVKELDAEPLRVSVRGVSVDYDAPIELQDEWRALSSKGNPTPSEKEKAQQVLQKIAELNPGKPRLILPAVYSMQDPKPKAGLFNRLMTTGS